MGQIEAHLRHNIQLGLAHERGISWALKAQHVGPNLAQQFLKAQALWVFS